MTSRPWRGAPAAEWRRSAARDQWAIHTDWFYRESAASVGSTYGAYRPIMRSIPEKNALHLSLGHFPRTLNQLPLINRYELRHICHRIPIEPRVLGCQQHVARGYRPPEIARQDNTNNRGDIATVERL